MVSAKGFFSFFHGNVLVLTVCRALWSFSTSISGPYLSLYILALGGTPVEVGWVNSLIIAGMFLYPVGGYIGDLKGRVKLVAICTYFYAVSHALYIFAQNWQTIAIGMFLTQFLLFYTPAMNALMADSLPPSVRGRGFATTMALPNAVRIVAPYIGGLLIAYFGGREGGGLVTAMRIAYAIALLEGLSVATIRLKFLKETVRGDTSEPGISIRSFPSLLKKSYVSVLESLRWMPSSLHFIIVLEILESFFVSLAGPFWIVYATEVIGLSPLDWGTLMLISGICGLTLSIPLGYLVDKFGARRVMLLSLSLAPISVFLFYLSSSFLVVAAALILLSVVNTSVAPSFSTIVANTIPKERRGRSYALLGDRGVNITTGGYFGGGFLLFLPAAVGAFIGGLVYEMGAGLPFIILMIALVMCFFIAFRFVREPEKAAI